MSARTQSIAQRRSEKNKKVVQTSGRESTWVGSWAEGRRNAAVPVRPPNDWELDGNPPDGGDLLTAVLQLRSRFGDSSGRERRGLI